MTEPDYAPPCCVEHCTRPTSRWTICDTHGDELGQLLASIADTILDRLSAAPLTPARDDTGIHGGGLKSHRNPVNLDTIVLRDRRSTAPTDGDPDGNRARSLLEVLHGWALRVRADMPLATPADGEGVWPAPGRAPGPYCDEWCWHSSCDARQWRQLIPWQPTVGSERRLLADNLEWIRRQHYAAAVLAEVRTVVQLLSGQPPARPVGVCPECSGDLWMNQGKTAKGERSVRCGSCSFTVAGMKLASLRKGAAA